jgi:hypothetical protein
MIDLFAEGNSASRPREVELDIVRKLTYLNKILHDISPVNARMIRAKCLPDHPHKRILFHNLLY